MSEWAGKVGCQNTDPVEVVETLRFFVQVELARTEGGRDNGELF
ncbi:MAG: hypothetical protein AAGA56_20965 [Myxococcota bacterium]